MIQRAAQLDRASKAQPSAESAPSFISSLFLGLASQRTTAVLVIALATLVAISAFVPQGREAIELARDPGATTMHRLVAWGLTDLFESAWLYALAVLLVANLLASAVTTLLKAKSADAFAPPAHAKLSADVEAAEPEHAAIVLRDVFRSGFGVPVHEDVDGSKVTMVFDTAPAGRLAPMATHIGLIILVFGAALVGRPIDVARAIPRADLEVKDISSGKIGIFDMVANEPWQFFRWPAKYTIRGYVPALDGLGPAVRIERSDSEGQRDAFWVFLKAPIGFDERHRKGEVAIRALKMGLVPPPGQGIASDPGAILLVAGLGLMVFGALAGRRPEGRIWLEADGDRVRVLGVPRVREDRSFARLFDRWRLLAASVLVER